MIITSLDLRQRLLNLNIDLLQIKLSDNAYFVPSLDWLQNEFSGACAEAFAGRDYSAEANDCDDFAWTAVALARRGNMQRREAREGITFGIIDLLMDEVTTINGVKGPGTHETNLVLCTVPNESEPRWILFEPQNRQTTRWADLPPYALSPFGCRF